MTEADWLALTSPVDKLSCLPAEAGERKVRLFAAACCRRILHLMGDQRSRAAVEVVERFADGTAGEAEREAAAEAALAAEQEAHAARDWLRFYPAHAARAAVDRLSFDPVFAYGMRAARGALGWSGTGTEAGERATQATLLLDILGNPFRPASLDRARASAASALARAAYEERALPSGELDPARLALLADALEDAGCTDAELLGHLREPGPHVRGCWAVDLVLGKQ